MLIVEWAPGSGVWILYVLIVDRGTGWCECAADCTYCIVDSRMGCECSHSVFIVKRGVTVKLNLEGKWL